MVTVSVLKADVGSYPGHVKVHESLLGEVDSVLAESDFLTDYRVAHCGDDVDLVMTHDLGPDAEEVHGLAWDAFTSAADVAGDLGLYGAGQDLLSDAFSGNVKGLGPGSAEMEFEERPAEPVTVFLCDKTEPAAFNLPLYRMFADPFNTSGLVLDPSLHDGFVFEVQDVKEGDVAEIEAPEELYDLLALIGVTSKYHVKSIRKPDGSPAAAVSTDKLNLVAGEYVGKDDPVAVVRNQSGFPAVGEATEAFSFPHLVSGWMRGSHHGPLMPVSQEQSTPSRFDGPPRVVGLGFQLKDGKLVGSHDLFDDPAFDYTRERAMEAAEYMRRHGPFQPNLVGAEDLEYTTLPAVLERLEKRFEGEKLRN
ncbi:MAG: Fructose-1,6-bisphosphate aldolase/phosphatase [Methanonatronarchaeales archaeon]|nr:Fructose-1,6-bisphosphate aldolase/phosphatase [Methanonatronarchaeales archaeon]